MKKFKSISLVIVALVSLIGCGNNDSEPTPTPTPTPEPSPEGNYIETTYKEPTEYVDIFKDDKVPEINPKDSDPHMSIEKTEYTKNDTIEVSLFNCESTYIVGLYPFGGYPGDMTALTYQYASFTTCNITTQGFESETKYNLYLYYTSDDSTTVFDVKAITITNNSNEDFGVTDASYSYDIETTEMRIQITPPSSKSLTYEVYWAKNGKRLDNYSYIKSFKRSASKTFNYSLGYNLFMPSEANQIEVYVTNGASTSLFIDVDSNAKVKDSNYLYSVNVYTDLHVRDQYDKPNHVEHLQAALNDAYNYISNSKCLFTVGDHTDLGTRDNYEYVCGLLNKYKSKAKCPYYLGFGNHEYLYTGNFKDQIDMYKEYANVEDTCFVKEVEGSTCIYLGSDSKSLYGSLQLTHVDWLQQQLDSADHTKPTFIFIHQPLMNTVSGSYEEQQWYGMTNVGEEIKEMLKNYKNTFVFTGHTHWEMESKYNSYINLDSTSYFNCASVGYLWNDYNKGEPGSEGYFVDVYDNCLLVKGRDFTSKKWLAYASYYVPFSL